MNCKFKKAGKALVCRQCGRAVADSGKRVFAQCKGRQRLGLGDWVAKILKVAGITPERWTKLTGSPCKCRKRQEQINWLGDAVARLLRSLLRLG